MLIKTAWRHLTRNRSHSFINIAGLSVGMTVSMLIGLWVWDEMRFDRYHEKPS
jgi:putative ABC transport system permease protein